MMIRFNGAFRSAFRLGSTMLHRLWAAAIVAALLPASFVFADDDLSPHNSDEPLQPVIVNQPVSVTAQLGNINGQPVFTQEVLAPIDADLARIARMAPTLEEFKRQARDAIVKQLKNMVGDMIVVRAAKDALTDDDQKRIDMFMNKERFDIITKHGGSVATTEQYFQSIGSSFDKELADKKRQLTIELYLRRKLFPKIQLDRQMILNRYMADIATYTTPASVDLYTITMPFTKHLPKEADPAEDGKQRPIRNPTPDQLAAAKAATIAEANEVMAALKAHGDFAQLAEDHSLDPQRFSGGRWKNTVRGSLLLKQVEDLAFSLPKNTLAEPLMIKPNERDGMVVIVKVGDVQPEEVTPFSTAQVTISAQLRNEQYVKLSRDYYNQLFSDSSVEAENEMVTTALDVAVTRYAMK
jgi:hypothetical protein